MKKIIITAIAIGFCNLINAQDANRAALASQEKAKQEAMESTATQSAEYQAYLKQQAEDLAAKEAAIVATQKAAAEKSKAEQQAIQKANKAKDQEMAAANKANATKGKSSAFKMPERKAANPSGQGINGQAPAKAPTDKPLTARDKQIKEATQNGKGGRRD
jgi:hypothetical protein